MARVRLTRVAVLMTAVAAFCAARPAFADVVLAQTKVPSLEVVVQSGARGDVNHCSPGATGKPGDNPMCFFDWDKQLASLKVKLPLKTNGKCVPAKEKLVDGLDLELGCATLVPGKGPPTKQSRAYKFTVALRDAAPPPRVATVVLEPGEVWKLGGFKDRRRAAKSGAQRDAGTEAGAAAGHDVNDAGPAAKPKRTALLVQLKLVE
jgi:hypothetical protein